MGVVNSKIGVKSWSEAPQNDIQKPSNVRNLAAGKEDALGGQDVGEFLNKIADPNWVDPQKKVRATGNDKLDKEAFMKLMLAQMKNQDPTNPMKSHEMAAQLAQFSSVEQLSNINTTLTAMQAGQKPTESFQALNFIGKAVAGDSAKLSRTKGDKNHDFTFNLPENAKEAQIRIKNANGEEVRKIKLADLKKGENNYVWNGMDERGFPTPAGDYQFFIEAKNANDGKLAVKTDFDGMITGVNYTSEGPVLLVGSQSVKLKDVKKIVDPSLANKDQNSQMNKIPDLKNAAPGVDTKNNAAGGAPDVATGSNLDNVKMSQGMIDQLQKETTTKQ